MTVSVYEHYRPVKENDQMLLVISNINYVKEPISATTPDMFADYQWSWYAADGSTRLFFVELDVREIPRIVNNFVFWYKISQPASISIYVVKATNVNHMPVVIREIIEHNLLS